MLNRLNLRFVILALGALLTAGLTACHRPPPPPPPDDRALPLAEHVAAQLAARTNGSYYFTGPRFQNNFFAENPRLAPDCWLAGVTNILAGSQAQITGGNLLSCADYMTPITPHLCIVTWHTVHGSDGFQGRTNIWLRPDGSLYANVSLLATNISGDLGLVVMAATNCTTVRILPDITRKVAAWQNNDFQNHLVPPAVRFHLGIGSTNRFHTTFVSGLTAMGRFAHTPGQLEFGDYSHGDNWVSGDSSGPSYLIIHNEAVFIGQVSSGIGVVALGTCSNELAAAAANLCRLSGLPVETPVYYDISGFPDQ